MVYYRHVLYIASHYGHIYYTNLSRIFVLILYQFYPTAEYTDNQQYFEEYYDEIEISEKASLSHFKSAMQVRNKEMVDRSDLVICYVEHNRGGAYQTIEYARKQNKRIINLAEDDSENDE